MSYLDKVLSGLPVEIKCEIQNHLIDLQQRSARNLSRMVGKTEGYLHDIKYVDIASRLVKINRGPVTSAREYHLMMYYSHPWYRSEINAKLPGGKVPDCTGRKWVGSAKIIDDATIAWNFLRCNSSYEFKKIRHEYLDYKKRSREPEIWYE
jgi:hypothetical protein